MRYLSVCSGIEAASVAWHGLGWQPLAFSEIEAFPRAVLAHHYPDVPLHGDFTKLRDEAWVGNADILVGGTPCQAFSVAGLRNSLADDRGNLTIEFVRLSNAIDAARSAAGREPGIVVWENVPGVLSTKDNAFGAFLAGLAGEDTALVPTGGRWTDAGVVDGPCRRIAWRILDAQFFGLAQRRRRVFVVASARDGFDPAAVLLEFEGVRRDTPPRREAGQDAAARATGRAGCGRGPAVDFRHECLTGDTVHTLQSKSTGGYSLNYMPGVLASTGDISHCLNAGGMGRQDYETETLVTHALRGEGFDASEDGTNRGTPLVPVAFSAKDHGADATADLSPTLRAMPHHASHANGGGQMAVAVPLLEVGKRTGPSSADDIRAGLGIGEDGDPMYTLQAGAQHGVVVGDACLTPWDSQQKRVYSTEADHAPTLSGSDGGGGRYPPAYAFQPRIARNGRGDMGDVVNALNAQSGETGKGDAAPCVATFQQSSMKGKGTIGYDNSGVAKPVKTQMDGQMLHAHMAVRRLTARECERLQGFPDDYTLIPWRNKPAADCPDGPRYKALGNSMAVPVMRWIGQRIAAELARASLPRQDHAA